MSVSSLHFFFLLGSTPELSWAELESSLPESCQLTRVNQTVAGVTQLPQDHTPIQVIDKLGGTVKIAELRQVLDQSEADAITSAIVTQLQATSGRIEFSLAEWGRDHLPKLDPQVVKQQLVAAGSSARYRESSRIGITAAVLLNTPDWNEMVVINGDDEVFIAHTVAVQDIDQWQIADRGKPFAQHQRGLLPPKVARAMVNLALGTAIFETDAVSATTLWDPFCGSGTILFEAALQGVSQLYGSDLDQESIAGTEQNWAWFQPTFAERVPGSTQLTSFAADATNIEHPPFAPNSISTIVTEPFLGKQTPNPKQIPNIQSGLERMYRGAFKAWRPWLQSGAKIVIVIPKWQSRQTHKIHEFHLHKLIDFLEPIGYTTTSEPIVYARPHAEVIREIWQFQFRPTK